MSSSITDPHAFHAESDLAKRLDAYPDPISVLSVHFSKLTGPLTDSVIYLKTSNINGEEKKMLQN
jgi:hypothetical protein